MHPNYEHARRWAEDPDAAILRRLEIARQYGVPEEPLRRYAAERDNHESGIAAIVEPDRSCCRGWSWRPTSAPGPSTRPPVTRPRTCACSSPSIACLISGDHLLGRISLYFDYGYSPDPVGEFVRSLDVVEALDARLCLPGHGRTFTDIHAHIEGNRTLVAERLSAILGVVSAGEPLTAFEILPRVYGGDLSPMLAQWLLTETLSMLLHLEVTGRAVRIAGEPERWTSLVLLLVRPCA